MSAEHDPIALPRYGRKLAESIPGAQFEQVPAASHGMTIQKSDEVSQRLRQWLGEVEARERLRVGRRTRNTNTLVPSA